MAEIKITGNTQSAVESINQLNGTLNNVDNNVAEINESTNKMSETMKAMKDKVAGYWTELNGKFQAVTGVLKMGWEAISGSIGKVKELAEEYEKLTNQMTILSSQKGSGEIILQLERIEQATNGVVGKFDILESVNKAVSFGIDLTGGRLEKLVSVSSKAAATMGVDLKFAFDSLIVGTARESKMILDNLGVMVDVTKANEDYAKSIGKTSAELSDVETKTALLSQVLERLGRTQDSIVDDELITSATGLFATMQRGWKAITLEVGEFASNFIQWIDDLGRSEIQIDKRKYSEMLGTVRDYYERKRALKIEEIDKETQDYFDKHKLMTAEEQADYVLSQNKRKIREGEIVEEKRLSDLKSSSLNKRIMEELIAQGQLQQAWWDTELWRQQVFEESGVKMEGENAYRMKNNAGIHSMYIEEIKKGFNEAEGVMIDYYYKNGMLVEEDFYLFKNRIADGVQFALKSLDVFAHEVTKASMSGKWGKSAIGQMFGLTSKDFDELLKGIDVGKLWKDILKTNDKGKSEKNKADKKIQDDEYKQQEKHLDNMIKLQDKYLKEDSKLYVESKNRKLKVMENEWKNEVKLDNKNITDGIDRLNRKDEMGVQLERETFDKKWSDMIEFEKKYNTDLGISGENLDKMTKEHLDERLKSEEQYQEDKNRVQQMGLQATAQFTAMLINDVLLGEKEFRKEMIGDFVKGMGTQMITDGTFHVLSGTAKGWGGIPTGWLQAKAGAVEVGTGIALGGIGKAIGTTSSGNGSDKSKDTTAKDSNTINQNMKTTQKVSTYLFPSERKYLQSLQESQGKLF